MICKQLADYSPVFYRPADSTQGDRDTVIATLTSLAVLPFASLIVQKLSRDFYLHIYGPSLPSVYIRMPVRRW
jgi:hypothetical protein